MSMRCMCSTAGHAFMLMSQEAQYAPLQWSDTVTGALLYPHGMIYAYRLSLEE